MHEQVDIHVMCDDRGETGLQHHFNIGGGRA